MKTSSVEEERKSDELFVFEEEELNDFYFIGREKPRWPIFKSMQAFLEPVPHHYRIIDRTVPRGESWQCTTKTGDTY